MIKTCLKCGVEKPFSEFSKDKNTKTGLQSQCKSCFSRRLRQYYQSNKEKIAEYKRQYYENNKEKIAEQNRQYYQNNKEKVAERNRQYYENNKEKVAEQSRRWCENIPAGLYQITNKKTGVVYIGCSTRLKMRWLQHKSKLRLNKHKNGLLQEAYNQCGLEGFKFEVIKEYPADTPFEVLEREETRLILEHKAKGIPIYNLSYKGCNRSIDENHLTL
jgi:exonuclease VII large subunit